MKAHLSIDQIVDFQHKLCSEKAASRIADHLEQCAECRKLAATVKDTLGQLDTIKGAPEASEQLITDTLRTVRNLDAKKRISFPRYVWIPGLAAAAVLLIIVTFTPTKQSAIVEFAKSEKFAEVQSPLMDLNVPQEAALADAEETETTTLGMEFAMADDADAVRLESTPTYDYAADVVEESESTSFDMDLAGNESLNQLARAQGLTPVKMQTERSVDEEMGEPKDDSIAESELDEMPELPEGNTEIAVLAMVAPSRDKEVHRELRDAPEQKSGGGMLFGALAQRKKARSMDAVAPMMSIAPAAEAPRQQHAPATKPVAPAETRITIDDRGDKAWQLGPYHSVRVTREVVPADSEIKDPQFMWTWRVSALNTSDVPARVLITRDFQTTNWNISVSDEADLFIRDSHSAEIRLDVPPQSERSFIYSIGTPVTAGSQ